MLESFMNLWKKLHDILDSLLKDHQATEEMERNFLSVKAEIARQHARLSEDLGLDAHFADEVMGMLSQMISLKDYLTLSATQTRRIESQWHHLFILMHGQLGKYQAHQEKKSSGKWLLRILKNPWVVLTLGVLVLVGIYFVGQRILH